MAFVIALIRNTDGAMLRICIILTQNRLLSLEVQKHGNTLALIYQWCKILNLFAICSSQVVYLEKLNSLKSVVNET